MSAFMVSDLHMHKIVTFAIEVLGKCHGSPWPNLYWGDTELPLKLTPENAQALGDLLMAENARSIGARYGHDAGCDADVEVFSYRYRRVAKVTTVEFLKLCQSLDYQSCEASDYYKTPASFVLRALMLRAIPYLPGYDAAEWAA